MSNGDPVGADAPRGKSRAGRKGRYDGSYTGTEQRVKNELMRQFMKNGEGPGGNSDAYRNASCWCACGRLILGHGKCAKCLEEAVEAPLEAIRADLAAQAWSRDSSADDPAEDLQHALNALKRGD